MKESEILNVGLALAMEWGENWLCPIQTRLAAQFPALTAQELDEYNTRCREAMFFGFKLVLPFVKRDGLNVKYREWEAAYLQAYPWANTANLGQLFSQAMYYSRK